MLPSRQISSSSRSDSALTTDTPDAVQAARDLVRVALELAAGVQLGQHDLRRGLLLDRVLVDRDAAAVVDHRDRVVDVDHDFDPVTEAGLGFVDRVVDDLVDQVVQARLAGRADVHGWPRADRLETLEDLDLARVVDVG